MSEKSRLGIDIGGTFTDLVLFEEGKLSIEKTPTETSDPEKGVMTGIDSLFSRIDRPPESISFLSHGTTVGTNAVLERDWAPTALITTEGFRDVLEIGRQDRPDIYDLQAEKPDPIVPRHHRYTVTERLDERGNVDTSLNTQEVRDIVQTLQETDRQSVAICLLFSFENPEHEEQIETIIEEMADDITYSLSSNILPEIREYERTLTTALNAALKPILQGYIRQLTDEIASKDIDPQLHIMQSNGGIITANVAAEKPVQTILSGPAAGVKGATFIGQNTGHDDLITMDMGGTSCDVSLVTGGEPTITTEGTIGDYSITVPMVDIHTVGAGGGSIAWIDKGEALRVGPQSAGAQPGPICYGRGGEEPTITDAHLLLGRLDPSRFVGGDFDVNRDRVAEIFKENLATPLDRSVEGAAQGVLDVANANMERALRVVSVEQGYDPREFTLVPFGGAGPLHGPKLAKQLDIPEVLIPRTAGVLSALGLLISDVIRDYSSTRVRSWDEVTVDVIKPLITDLHEQGESYLEDIGIRSTNQSYEYYLDVRYAGQSHDISVPISEAITPETLEEVQTRFHSRHEQRYGHADRSEDIELVTIRVRARGEVTPPSLPSLDRSASREDAIIEQRTVVFEGEDYHTTVYDRPTIPPECSFAGPAIIEGTESTTVVYPDQTVSVDEYGNLRITHSS